MCWVYLGRPWLHPLCCRAQCQSLCRGRCYGHGSVGLKGEVRDAGLDKGLTKVLYSLLGISACGYCVLLFGYSTRINQCHSSAAVNSHLSTFTTVLQRLQIPDKICRNTRSHMWIITRKRVKVHLMQHLGKSCYGTAQSYTSTRTHTQYTARPEIASFLLRWSHTAAMVS